MSCRGSEIDWPHKTDVGLRQMIVRTDLIEIITELLPERLQT
jgi:hypothetical protein